MNAYNDNKHLPPIQLLVPACASTDAATDATGLRLGWLHGYCLLTLRHVGADLTIDGEVRIGNRYGENAALTQALADALEPGAVLAGCDLTSIIGQLGRLPIEANNPAPALHLLAKLRTMLEQQAPLDLALSEQSSEEVLLQALHHKLIVDDDPVDEYGEPLDFGGTSAGTGNGNPHRQATDLADTAGLYLLTVGSLYLAEEQQMQLLTAWQAWRGSFQPLLPLPTDDGDPTVIA